MTDLPTVLCALLSLPIVANARRDPGERLLAAMGLRKIVAFERVKVPQ